MPAQPITLHSRWCGKLIEKEVTLTRVTFRNVSFIALDKTFSGTLPVWQCFGDFQPVTERKKKTR